MNGWGYLALFLALDLLGLGTADLWQFWGIPSDFIIIVVLPEYSIVQYDGKRRRVCGWIHTEEKTWLFFLYLYLGCARCVGSGVTLVFPFGLAMVEGFTSWGLFFFSCSDL